MLFKINTKLISIENRIFIIRGVAVMLDNHLAEIYSVEIKRLNEQVKRNIVRFPTNFMFQLNNEEWHFLRSQFATLENKQGFHRKYLPYVFTEQGVAMLSAILKSQTAISISIQIMDAFVEMRKKMISWDGLKNRMDHMESRQLLSELKLDELFSAIEKADTTPKQGIFYNGQIFDAYHFASDLIRSANQFIILIDNYIDETTLALLSKRKDTVTIILYAQILNEVMKKDIQKWKEQFGKIEFRTHKNNHDRFLIIDNQALYHLGASLKDLGRKLFAFSRMDQELERLRAVL
jgi:hypothetical protein